MFQINTHLLRISALIAATTLVACATVPGEEAALPDTAASTTSEASVDAPDTQSARDNSRYLPRIGGNTQLIEDLSTEKLEHLRLISIDLVSALVQLPAVNPTAVTLQVTEPKTAFGNLVVRALEDSGYGLQRVSADQGLHYVQYSQRFAETDAGPITDYVLRVGDVSLDREYIENENGVYPSSLLKVDGAERPDLIQLDESIFQEQGGDGEIFVSGVAAGRNLNDVREFSANAYDKTPVEQRRARSEQLLTARRSAIARVVTGEELEGYDRLRRTVLIFDNPETRIMGAGNKQAVRLLVREYEAGDIFQIAACTDVDGKNDESVLRGIRVVEEFLSYDIPVESVVKAPCRRSPSITSVVDLEIYRHANRKEPYPRSCRSCCDLYVVDGSFG